MGGKQKAKGATPALARTPIRKKGEEAAYNRAQCYRIAPKEHREKYFRTRENEKVRGSNLKDIQKRGGSQKLAGVWKKQKA